MPKNDAQVGAGCILSLLQLLITGPIWYILLFGILDRTDAPTWQWALYWVYLPVGVALASLRVFVESVLGD